MLCPPHFGMAPWWRKVRVAAAGTSLLDSLINNPHHGKQNRNRLRFFEKCLWLKLDASMHYYAIMHLKIMRFVSRIKKMNRLWIVMLWDHDRFTYQMYALQNLFLCTNAYSEISTTRTIFHRMHPRRLLSAKRRHGMVIANFIYNPDAQRPVRYLRPGGFQTGWTLKKLWHTPPPLRENQDPKVRCNHQHVTPKFL